MKLRKWILVSVLSSMLVGCGGSWSSGDRVLVSKCSYDLGITKPERYQVVVFKYPRGPMDKHTPKNYIKRLLGLPGELLAIFFGRLYHRAPVENEALAFDDVNDAKVDRNDLWTHMHTNDPKSRDWFKEGKLEILRKPPAVMLALRRIVYDNDFQARDLKGKFDRWSPDPKSGWKSDKTTGFAFDAKDADRVDWLRYQHLVVERPAPIAGDQPHKPRLITDTMDYNSFKSTMRDHTPSYPHWVGDLMIEANVEVAEGKGEFWYELSKGPFRYQARWDLASGQCTVYRLEKDGTQMELGSEQTTVKGPGNYMLRFANIDARLTVWVNSVLPFGDGKKYDPPEVRAGKDDKRSDAEIEESRGPRQNDLQPASIGSKGAAIKISHVRLWRDTYYTTSVSEPDYNHHLDHPSDLWMNPGHWERFQGQKFATMYVQPGHYLCLGDNSQASSDSREWGLVPARLMLGRALVVYYPIDRIGPIR